MTDHEKSSEPKTEEPNSSSEENTSLEKVEDASWELLLEREPPPEDPSNGESQIITPSWQPWLRASIPLIILLAYFCYKIASSESRTPPPDQYKTATAITNTKPPELTPDLNREDKRALNELIGSLDLLQQSRSWKEMLTKIEQSKPDLQVNEAVQAFKIYAQVQTGNRNTELRQQIARLRPYFTDQSNKKYLDILNYSDAKILYSISSSQTALMRNNAELHELLSQQSTLTRDVLLLRLRLAERFEIYGDEEFEASGSFRRDQLNLANARSYYQQAFRWVTTKEGWLELQPIDSSVTNSMIQRLRIKMVRANNRFHGPSIPFGDGDSDTWTGKRGDPIHDRPGGTW